LIPAASVAWIAWNAHPRRGGGFNMKIREIMSPNPVCCVPHDSAQKVAKILCEHTIGSVPVIDNEQSRKLVGMITDRDLCCSVIASGLDPNDAKIANFMTVSPVSCRDGDNLEKCERAMQEHQIRRMPVVDGEGRCVGIVSQADLALNERAGEGCKDGGGDIQT
jgi:CBS domain-containing protein